jgi:hypothetical protein
MNYKLLGTKEYNNLGNLNTRKYRFVETDTIDDWSLFVFSRDLYQIIKNESQIMALNSQNMPNHLQIIMLNHLQIIMPNHLQIIMPNHLQIIPNQLHIMANNHPIRIIPWPRLPGTDETPER